MLSFDILKSKISSKDLSKFVVIIKSYLTYHFYNTLRMQDLEYFTEIEFYDTGFSSLQCISNFDNGHVHHVDPMCIRKFTRLFIDRIDINLIDI